MKQEKNKLSQEMHQLITKWKQSGMKLKTFSKSHEISYEKLKYWKQKFNLSSQNSKQKLTNLSKDTPDFISIDVPNIENAFTALELTYPNNVKLSFPSGITLNELKTLIKIF